MAALTVTSLFIKLTNSLSEFEGCQLFGIPSRGKPRSLKVTPAFGVDSFQGSPDLLFFELAGVPINFIDSKSMNWRERRRWTGNHHPHSRVPRQMTHES